MRENFRRMEDYCTGERRNNFWRKLEPTRRRRVAGGIILNKQLTHIVLVKSIMSGKWGIPKGGIEDDETDIQGAIREIYEECGLSIESPYIEAMAPCITFRGVRIFLFCYNGSMRDHKLFPIDTLEISECGWFPLDTILDFDLRLDEYNTECTECKGCIECVTLPYKYEEAARLPSISSEFPQDYPIIEFMSDSTLDLGNISKNKQVDKNNCKISKKNDTLFFPITTLLRDLLKEKLDSIIRKINTNINNYEAKKGRIIINNYLAQLLGEYRQAEIRQVNIIRDILEQFPMVFYVPELLKVLEATAA